MVLVLGSLSGLESSRNKVCREVWSYFLGMLEQWILCCISSAQPLIVLLATGQRHVLPLSKVRQSL